MAVPASDVYVCENPSVLIAAADQLGESSRPLVCTNGRPSAAALRLLTGLAEGGTSIHVRADDDTSGQAIDRVRDGRVGRQDLHLDLVIPVIAEVVDVDVDSSCAIHERVLA
jgi:hypothetical protein